jgi:hypothetical protein
LFTAAFGLQSIPMASEGFLDANMSLENGREGSTTMLPSHLASGNDSTLLPQELLGRDIYGEIHRVGASRDDRLNILDA